ncbi:MAG: hypothetical protein U5Q03_01860 [Bacteroidota bacterium]|nr:hypothetical protein [Bacteroidota bacterium]
MKSNFRVFNYLIFQNIFSNQVEVVETLGCASVILQGSMQANIGFFE